MGTDSILGLARVQGNDWAREDASTHSFVVAACLLRWRIFELRLFGDAGHCITFITSKAGGKERIEEVGKVSGVSIAGLVKAVLVMLACMATGLNMTECRNHVCMTMC